MVRRAVRAALIVLAGVLLGCPGRISTTDGTVDADGGGALFVLDVLAPQPPTAGGYTSDPAQPSISSGVLDVALHPQYEPTYLVGYRFAQATEADAVTVQGATIRLTDASGNTLDTFTELTSATIEPGPGGGTGYAPVTVTTIDQGTLQGDTALQDSIANGGTARFLTYVTFFAASTDGTVQQSDEFAFPVDVCRGCRAGQ
jgi:hypothetical protein